MKETCGSYIELMQRKIDGEISSAEEEKLTKHLALCPNCRADFKAFQQLDRSFLETKLLSPPLELKDYVMTEINRLQENPKVVEQKKVFQLIRA